MKKQQVISQKFMEQYFSIAKLLFNDAMLNKTTDTGFDRVKKIETDLYRLYDDSGKSVGILDPQTFWRALQRTEVSKYFNWDKSTYQIVCAKLN